MGGSEYLWTIPCALFFILWLSSPQIRAESSDCRIRAISEAAESCFNKVQKWIAPVFPDADIKTTLGLVFRREWKHTQRFFNTLHPCIALHGIFMHAPDEVNSTYTEIYWLDLKLLFDVFSRVFNSLKVSWGKVLGNLSQWPWDLITTLMAQSYWVTTGLLAHWLLHLKHCTDEANRER